MLNKYVNRIAINNNNNKGDTAVLYDGKFHQIINKPK